MKGTGVADTPGYDLGTKMAGQPEALGRQTRQCVLFKGPWY